MQQITVRRWVEADPADVWARLADPDALVAHEPRLGIAAPFARTGRLRPADRAVFACRTRGGITRLTLEVVAVDAPHHLVGTLAARGGRWLLAVDVEPIAEGMADVALRVSDETPVRRLPRTASTVARNRALEAIGLLLETAVARLERPVIELVRDEPAWPQPADRTEDRRPAAAR